MEELVQVQAILDGISTRKDRSLKIVFETQEVTADQGFKLFNMRDQFGWLLFSPSLIQQEQVPESTVREPEVKKSPAQRLRDVLYRYWEQRGKAGEFEGFYKAQMERLIESVKEKLAR